MIAINTPAQIPKKRPAHADPVAQLPSTAAKAPESIMPSNPKLMTPLSSESNPPKLARRSGVAFPSVRGMRWNKLDMARSYFLQDDCVLFISLSRYLLILAYYWPT